MKIKQLKNGLYKSLIEADKEMVNDYQMQLIDNEKQIMIDSLVKNLLNCQKFIFSVAFITKSGVALLKTTLLKLEEKAIPGIIICSDYLYFSEPEALKELSKFTNIELRINTGQKMHEKGYFFIQEKIVKIIIGSSNLTQNALTINQEMNVEFPVTKNANMYYQFKKRLTKTYEQSQKYQQIIEEYSNNYQVNQQVKMIKSELKLEVPKPNLMQQQAVSQLQKDYHQGKTRSLVISATGTGKTFLAAFAVKKFKPQKMLFIVHRQLIAQKALETFKQVMPERKMQLYNSENQDITADYLFTTIQTISRNNHLEHFNSAMFDYIIIDEVHHSGAKTYQKVINYFTPKFLLGLSATPERSDDFNIYQLFNYNVSYELRLHDALKSELLVPFHYYGIADIVNYNNKTKISDFKQLISSERAKHIWEKSQFYGHSGSTLHGLIFVSTIIEAKELSKNLNHLGAKVKVLSANDSEQVRQNVINQLEKALINYIITVDLFNEGIDIPCINQVIFLRRTSSSIVYIQQLGRGLRLNNDKEYLVVLDFIGNYDNDFLIPIALSGDKSFDKNKMLQFINNGTNLLPGASSIDFEEIAQKRILKHIAKVNLSQLSLIKQAYDQLYFKLGRIPLINDFYWQKEIDPQLIFANKKFSSNVEFVEYFSKTSSEVDEIERKRLAFICQKFSPAKRIHEIAIIELLMKTPSTTIELNDYIERKYHLSNQRLITENALLHLQILITQPMYVNYEPIIEKVGNKYRLLVENNIFLKDLIDYNINYYLDNFKYESTLVPYQLYKKSELLRLLLMKQGHGELSGYLFDHQQKKCVIYLNFDDMGAFGSFNNEIIDNNKLTWFSTKNRYLSKNGQITNEGKLKNGEYEIQIMARRNRSQYYYYLGSVLNVLNAEETTIVDDKTGKTAPIVAYVFEIIPMDFRLKEYLTTGVIGNDLK